MGALFMKRGFDKIKGNEVQESLWNMKINDITGKERTLAEFKEGKTAFVFVNVACK